MSNGSFPGTSRRTFVVSGVAMLLLLIAGEALALAGFIRNITAGAEAQAVMIMIASAAFTAFLIPGFFSQPTQTSAGSDPVRRLPRDGCDRGPALDPAVLLSAHEGLDAAAKL